MNDIRKEKGFIGWYKGKEMHVVHNDNGGDFLMAKPSKIYVIADNRYYYNLMVNNGFVIGYINAKGEVTDCKNPFVFSPKVKKQKKKKKKL